MGSKFKSQVRSYLSFKKNR